MIYDSKTFDILQMIVFLPKDFENQLMLCCPCDRCYPISQLLTAKRRPKFVSSMLPELVVILHSTTCSGVFRMLYQICAQI